MKKETKIAIVAAVACGLLNIVASIYKPFSVNAVGLYLLCCPRPVFFKVKKIDLKEFVSSSVNFKIYPSGNFSGLFLTA